MLLTNIIYFMYLIVIINIRVQQCTYFYPNLQSDVFLQIHIIILLAVNVFIQFQAPSHNMLPNIPLTCIYNNNFELSNFDPSFLYLISNK